MYHFYLQISRKTSNILALIKYDQAVMIDGLLHQPDQTIQITDLEYNLELLDIPFSISLAKNSDSSKQPLEGDLVLIGLINPQSNKKITIKSGYISEVSYTDHVIHLSMRGQLEQLNIKLGLQYTTNCSNNFGDKICAIQLEKYIIRKIPIVNIKDNLLEVNLDYWQSKIVDFDKFFLEEALLKGSFLDASGNKIAQIYDYEAGKFSVICQEPSFLFRVGEEVDLLLGCSKSFAICSKFFANKDRFMGQPLLD